jgi:hypothetical protein
VRDHADQHGDGDDGDGPVGRRAVQFLQREEREHHRRQAPGTEPRHQGGGGQAEPRADQRDRHRDHPDDREAEDRVQHHRPGHGVQRRRDLDGAEGQPDQQGHQGPGLLDERHQGLAAPAAGRAEREPGRERREEPVAPRRHGERVGAHRQAEHRRAGEALGRPAALARGVHQQAAGPAGGQADEDAHGQLGHRRGRAVPGDRATARRPRQRDRDKRRGDPVVEAALDVDQPADPGRYHRVGQHARAERGVGRRQRRPHQQRQPNVVADQGERQQRAQADRHRKGGPEQPRVQPGVHPQLVQSDPRRVGEQHQGEGELGQFLDQRPARRDGQERQRPVGKHQPGEHEDDRRGHVEPLQPRRQRAPAEDQRRHDGKVGNAHGRCSPGGPAKSSPGEGDPWPREATPARSGKS